MNHITIPPTEKTAADFQLLKPPLPSRRSGSSSESTLIASMSLALNHLSHSSRWLATATNYTLTLARLG
jgi:hypothetical protein